MAINYKTCSRCTGIFVYRGSKMCDKCVREVDDMFVKIRDYIYKNPDATVVEVLESVPAATEQDILNFLKEGRLEMKDASSALKCEKCGVPVSTGRLCEACKKELSSVLSTTLESRAQSSQAAGRRGTTSRNSTTGFKSKLKDR